MRDDGLLDLRALSGGQKLSLDENAKVLRKPQVEVIFVARMIAGELALAAPAREIEWPEPARHDGLPAGHGCTDPEGDARLIEQSLFMPLIQIGAVEALHRLPGKGNLAPRRIHAMKLRRRHTDGADLIEQRRFHFQMIILLRPVLHAHEHLHAIHIGAPREMVALARAGAQCDVLRSKMPLQGFAKLPLDLRIRFAALVRAVKCGRTIAFPIVDVAAAHGCFRSPALLTGLRREYAAMRMPMSHTGWGLMNRERRLCFMVIGRRDDER